MSEQSVRAVEKGRGGHDRAALALLAAGLGAFDWDIERGLVWVSPQLAAMTGWPAGTASAKAAPIPADRLHPDDRADFTAAVDKVLAGSGRLDTRVRLAGHGASGERWFDLNALVLADRRGRPQRMVGVLRDISTDKGEADQLRTLVAELDHRVKNVLAAVQSLAAQSARRTMTLDSFLKTFFGRLQAMAAAHTLLTATRWRGVDISHVAAAELGGLAQGQARWGGPEIVLSPRATHALTLALHELGANAVKYGALSTDAGRIDVRWRALEGGGFELEWIELHGPIVSPPHHRGFGSMLLERVTGRELGGDAVLDFRPDGLRVRITGDRSALASAAEPAPQAADAPSTADLASDGEDKPGASYGGSPAPDIRGLRVLIVEDAVLLALELESGLTECGASVVGIATKLPEAMRLLDEDFDVAILDADLNGCPVTPVACALETRDVPFILATGFGESGSACAAFEAPVVRKPFNIHQIAGALAEAVQGRAKARRSPV